MKYINVSYFGYFKKQKKSGNVFLRNDFAFDRAHYVVSLKGLLNFDLIQFFNEGLECR